MPREFKEGVEDISEEQFPDQLRGIVVDEDFSGYYRNWIFTGIAFIIFIIVISWVFLQITRTEEAKLRDKFADPEVVASLLEQYNRDVQKEEIATTELRRIVVESIIIASTIL